MSQDILNEERARAVEKDIRAEQQKFFVANGGKGDVRDFLRIAESDDGWQRLNRSQQELYLSLNSSSLDLPL